MARTNKVSLFIGTRGSGKTWFTIKEFIPWYMRRHPSQKVLVLDMVDHPDYQDLPRITPGHLARWSGAGIYRMFQADTAEMLQGVKDHFINGLLIVEDASRFLGGVLDDDTKKFVLNSKQRNIDIVFMFHSFSYAPPKLLEVTDIFEIFRTASPAGRKQYLNCYDEVFSKWQEVMSIKKGWPHRTVVQY